MFLRVPGVTGDSGHSDRPTPVLHVLNGVPTQVLHVLDKAPLP